MKNIFKKIIKLIFPPKCIFCGDILDIMSGQEICASCYKEIPFIEGELRIKNGNREDRNYYDRIICLCHYSGIIKHSLIRYKFFNKPSYYRAFAELLSDKIKEAADIKEFDLVASVPLHKHKAYIRGYNQAFLVSRALSRETGIAERSRILTRIKDTKSQSLLPKNKRYLNVESAFKIAETAGIAGKSVLLVDDILTTGYTLNECAKVLKEAGAVRVTAAVIASGRKVVINYIDNHL